MEGHRIRMKRPEMHTQYVATAHDRIMEGKGGSQKTSRLTNKQPI